MLVHDMLGRKLDIPEQPARIVSIVPSQTELLHHLGLEQEVVGITKFCVHPEDWFRSKTRVGGTKTVHLDRVAALQPDLILANKEENVAAQVDALNTIAPVWVSDIRTLPEALVMIREVSRLTGAAEKGEELARAVEAGFSGLEGPTLGADGLFQDPPSHRPASVAYGIWRDPWMWAGGDTFISDILHRIGWRNALQQLPRYPELGLEDLANMKPGLVLLSSEPYPFREKHLAEVRQALPDSRVHLVDGEMFSWYGSRLLLAVDYFRSLIAGES